MSERLPELAANYRVNEAGEDVIADTRIVLLSGIISAGKDSIQSTLLSLPEFKDSYHSIVTHTTRAPRYNNEVLEIDGREYHFVTEDELEQLLLNHEMVEVNRFGEKYYGTSIEEFRTANTLGKIALGDIDINGIDAFHRIAKDSVTAIFIVPPDYDTWRQRLEKRYPSAEALAEVWESRRAITIEELKKALAVPYYHFVINDDLQRATGVVNSIAHRETDFFKRGDDEARIQTRDLLEAIEQHP